MDWKRVKITGIGHPREGEKEFSGTVVRVEPDGFGVVRFDHPIGANTFGIFSTTITSSTLPSDLRPGAAVEGVAVITQTNASTVKSIWIKGPSAGAM